MLDEERVQGQENHPITRQLALLFVDAAQVPVGDGFAWRLLGLRMMIRCSMKLSSPGMIGSLLSVLPFAVS